MTVVWVEVFVERVLPPSALGEPAVGLESTTGENGSFAPRSLALWDESVCGPAIATPAKTSATVSNTNRPEPIRAQTCFNVATALSSAADDGIREAFGMKAVWMARSSLGQGSNLPVRGRFAGAPTDRSDRKRGRCHAFS
jgi:hypothetical protein